MGNIGRALNALPWEEVMQIGSSVHDDVKDENGDKKRQRMIQDEGGGGNGKDEEGDDSEKEKS